MNATDAITLAMSRQDGARAAAVLWVEGRINPDTKHVPGWGDAREWGHEDFVLEDASTAAFLGNGCECFSRHNQMTGSEWENTHCDAFHEGFLAVALECLLRRESING